MLVLVMFLLSLQNVKFTFDFQYSKFTQIQLLNHAYSLNSILFVATHFVNSKSNIWSSFYKVFVMEKMGICIKAKSNCCRA